MVQNTTSHAKKIQKYGFIDNKKETVFLVDFFQNLV
jgi:hypothetical protein